MIEHRLLTSEEFLACFTKPMRDMTAAPEAVTDIWPYVDALNLTSLGITQVGDVAHTYRVGSKAFDQVLIQTGEANVFLVVVVNLAARAVLGHHLLDLNIEYGTATQH